ncbi:hypothetical protein Glove_66g169 [Diversispora epigaea]|uniref:Uncharacterized protein n=1 Tax=Diversispora epigaea TaxID=1348612 RepID=A0A397JJL7_9GLOM|nr:hypothetical protein Glove_66g169 [Diversispora epigaea]
MPPKTSRKRKNPEIVESENSNSSVSQRRSKRPARHVTIRATNESENFLAPQRRQSERLANLAGEDSGLVKATNDLNISDISRSRTGSRSSIGSRSSYDMKDLSPSSVKFTTEDMEALNANFIPSSNKNEVIPDVEGKITKFPEQYVLPGVDCKILGNADSMFANLKVIDMDETFTDTCVDNLLRIAKLNNFPLMIRNQPSRKLHIKDVLCVSSEPDFVIEKIEKQSGEKNNIVVIDDKHMKNVGRCNGFGETQIAIKILACGSENVRSTGEYTDQTLWAVRNGWKAGFDFAEPDGRQEVLTALVKIRQKLLQ